MTALPDWMLPIRDGALTITGEDITKWLVPEDSDARPGAVLMVFGEGASGPDLLLTERAHTMRSHPRHGRACHGYPRLHFNERKGKTWMPGSSPGMTT